MHLFMVALVYGSGVCLWQRLFMAACLPDQSVNYMISMSDLSAACGIAIDR